MFLFVLIVNIIFLGIYLIIMIGDLISIGIAPDSKSVFNLLWRVAGPLGVIAGLIFHIPWLIVLGLTGYSFFAFDTLMNWLVPSFSFANMFTLRNIISGKAAEMVRNMPKDNFVPARKKITKGALVLCLIAITAFVVTLIYYSQAYPSGN